MPVPNAAMHAVSVPIRPESLGNLTSAFESTTMRVCLEFEA